MMKNPKLEADQLIKMPGLNLLKRAVDPMLSGMPDWLHAIVWAIFVLALLYLLVYWLFRHALPWTATVLATPTRAVIEFSGVILLLPGYFASTLIRRASGGVPGVMFVYDEVVRNVTRTGHWTTGTLLSSSIALRKTSKLVIVVLLFILVGLWDITYCTDAGADCRPPTSQWMKSVSHAINAPQPTPTPTPCPKKRRSGHAAKCTTKHQ